MVGGHTLPILGQKTSLKAVTSGKEVTAFAILGAENIIVEIINPYISSDGRLDTHPQPNGRSKCCPGKMRLRAIG